MDEPVVVVVEDDPSIGALLDMYLRPAGFRPLLAPTGGRGLELIEDHRPALVVLDVGLPDVDGFEVGRRLRARGGSIGDTPILFLTARGAEIDRLAGFGLGADDYVVKPFSPRELVARAVAIVARTNRTPTAHDVVDLDGIRLDRTRRLVSLDGRPVAMTVREFDLLTFLARNRTIALSRRQILDGAWGLDWEGDERTVDVHVGQLRRKLGTRLRLETVWGVGYRLG